MSRARMVKDKHRAAGGTGVFAGFALRVVGGRQRRPYGESL